MSSPRNERSLGRGLSALMAEIEPEEGGTPPQSLPIEAIVPNPDQPRQHYDPERLEQLARSIADRGILQPLIVRPHPEGGGLYQIVAGERRWRAAQSARLHEVPVIIRDLGDAEVMEIALIENLQRADLNAMEEAVAVKALMDRFGHTQEALGAILHKSRSHVANTLRLLSLPAELQDHVREDRLSAGHARALITAPDPGKLARKVIAEGLSVRATEALARRSATPGGPRRQAAERDADTRALEGDLSAQLKMSVRIDHQGHDGGYVRITYRSLEDLDRLCQILASQA